jgi:DNA-binding MarR family transcriptional regulator
MLAGQMERDLSVIRKALRKPLEAEVSRGELTMPQKAVMQVVVRNHGISLKDLGREVNLAHSTVSGIVDRLAKRGMLERRSDSEDGRFARIHPTAEVEAFVRELMPALMRGPLERALKRATKEERSTIGNALRRLAELLEDQ